LVLVISLHAQRASHKKISDIALIAIKKLQKERKMKSKILQLPSNYVKIEEKEKENLDGGALSYEECSFGPSLTYLSTAAAYEKAAYYADKELWDGKSYSQHRLAAEIYAHTVAYYASLGLLTTNLGVQIFASAREINLGGDDWKRVAAYEAVYAAGKAAEAIGAAPFTMVC